MNQAPILVLQMQRMGDLVLSFPLLGWLTRCFPGHPLWVLGEPHFFEPLMPLSPSVTYFAYTSAPNLAAHSFHAVINLSHRPEAASLAGTLVREGRADALFGAYQDKDGRLFIRGDWHLYRASLTHNNRYNLFHWADLNALDCIPPETLRHTTWPLPRPLPGVASAPRGNARIGLFLGASEREKHPDAVFWSQLAKRLLLTGHRPVLLGGEAEQALGAQTAQMLGAPALNLCGKFTVSALARFIAELDLLITPDTGPMHIAVWTGTPVLNLSLGPVNPWETGPFAPGHHVVRSLVDCAPCWRCTRPAVVCRERMAAPRVAAIAENLLDNGGDKNLESRARGLELLSSTRDSHALYSLHPVLTPLPLPDETGSPRHPQQGARMPRPRRQGDPAQLRLARFWQAWFGYSFGLFEADRYRKAWKNVLSVHPEETGEFHQAVASLARTFAAAVKDGGASLLGDTRFWQRLPALLHPFSGYIHMYVQNDGGSRAALLRALEMIDSLAALEE